MIMRITNRLCFALFLLFVGVLSCKKESTTTNSTTTNTTTTSSTKTPKEILIASKWKKLQYKENGVVKPFFGTCEMDDILTFSSNGEYTMNDGATRCSYTTNSND